MFEIGREVSFEELGLSAHCGRALAGVVFHPKKGTLEVYPEQGYTFFIKDTAGEVRIVSWDLQWPLLYSLKDGTWYLHDISPEQTLRIKTLKIKKDTPYNPQDYQKP